MLHPLFSIPAPYRLRGGRAGDSLPAAGNSPADPAGSFEALQAVRALHMDGGPAGARSYLVVRRGADHEMLWVGFVNELPRTDRAGPFGGAPPLARCSSAE